MIAVGALFVAPWGRYAVERIDGTLVVLADQQRAHAFVCKQLADLEASSDYRAVAPAAPPSRPAKPPTARRDCDDCGRVSAVLWHHGDPEDPTSLRFCPGCMQRDASTAYPPTLSLWRPAPGEASESRAEVGSFEPPAGTKRAPARAPRPSRDQTRSMWQAATREVAR